MSKEDMMREIVARRERIRRHIVAGVPEVGIWWIHRGKAIVSSVPFNEGIDYGDFVTGPTDHYRYWEQIRRLVPGLKNLEYDEVPRGRVAYRKPDRTFIILGSKAMLRDPKAVGLIKSEFKLLGRKVVLDPDEHYEL